MSEHIDLKAAEDFFWECSSQGIHYPVEWKGRLTVEQGYRLQLGLLARHCKAGARHVGWKVGLTALSIQQQVNYMEPVFGYLLDRNRLHSGAAVPFDDLIAPNFESELCVTLDRALSGPGVQRDAANAAIGAVAPAIELVERRGDFAADPALSMADNVQQRYVVMGKATSRLPSEPPLSEVTVRVSVNGESVAEATGREVMGDPAASVAWLANKLHEFGLRLEAGVQIMTGSFTRQFPVALGDLIEAEFEPYGSVRVEFV